MNGYFTISIMVKTCIVEYVCMIRSTLVIIQLAKLSKLVGMHVVHSHNYTTAVLLACIQTNK